MQLALRDSTFQLLPERALFFPATHTLVVADLHLGKATAMRNNGLPVADDESLADLARLSALLVRTAATQLVIAGDLLHAPSQHPARMMAAIGQFRSEERRVGK